MKKWKVHVILDEEYDDIEALKEPKQGEWEHWGSPFSDDTIADSIVCSVCKARFVEIKGEVFNFCPNCGARMKGGDEK